MAGDWIKMETCLARKPEVASGLTAALGLDEFAVIGRLFALWAWADEQSVDGNAVRVTEPFLDRLTNCPGFAVALRQVGWLAGRDGLLEFPNFGRHNGQTAKSRALARDRAKRFRNADVTRAPLPEKRREEKRRKNKDPPNPPDPKTATPADGKQGPPEAQSRWRPPAAQVGVLSARAGNGGPAAGPVDLTGDPAGINAAESWGGIEALVLGSALDSPKFKAAWHSWVVYTGERGLTLTASTVRHLIGHLKIMGPDRSVAAITCSIRNGWKSIFEDRHGTNADGKTNSRVPAPPGKYAAVMAEARRRNLPGPAADGPAAPGDRPGLEPNPF